MSQAKTKSAPAAPKTTKAPAPQTSKGRYSPIKKERTRDETVIFEIIKGGGIICKIKSEIPVYDKLTKKVRQIRYCPGETSIFKDEQSESSVRSHVVFRDGLLSVPEEKANLREFLYAHSSNIDNGGGLFRIVDNSRNTEAEVDQEYLVHDAVALVRTKELDEILAVAVALNINIEQKTLEIRRELLKEAKSNPDAFIRMFDDPRVRVRSAIIQSKDFQIIKMKNDGAYWFDSGNLILSVPPGQDPIDTLVRYCLTERGTTLYEEVLARLEKMA